MHMKQEGKKKKKKGSLRAERAVQEPGIAAKCPHTGLGGDSALILDAGGPSSAATGKF